MEVVYELMFLLLYTQGSFESLIHLFAYLESCAYGGVSFKL